MEPVSFLSGVAEMKGGGAPALVGLDGRIDALKELLAELAVVLV